MVLEDGYLLKARRLFETAQHWFVCSVCRVILPRGQTRSALVSCTGRTIEQKSLLEEYRAHSNLDRLKAENLTYLKKFS
jgi:hypothetical protein